jgi:hypothetical protein
VGRNAAQLSTFFRPKVLIRWPTLLSLHLVRNWLDHNRRILSNTSIDEIRCLPVFCRYPIERDLVEMRWR